MFCEYSHRSADGHTHNNKNNIQVNAATGANVLARGDKVHSQVNIRNYHNINCEEAIVAN